MKVRLTPQAKADIESSVLYLAADDPAAARRWLLEIERRCADLGVFPEMGTARSDVRPGLRLLPVGNFLILYRVGRAVEVVRVIHGARRWEELLRPG